MQCKIRHFYYLCTYVLLLEHYLIRIYVTLNIFIFFSVRYLICVLLQPLWFICSFNQTEYIVGNNLAKISIQYLRLVIIYFPPFLLCFSNTLSPFSDSDGECNQLKLLPENNFILFGHEGGENDIKNLIFSQIPVVLHL